MECITQGQCQYFVVRKKRLCRMTVRPGRQYCGEHEPQPPGSECQVQYRNLALLLYKYYVFILVTLSSSLVIDIK